MRKQKLEVLDCMHGTVNIWFCLSNRMDQNMTRKSLLMYFCLTIFVIFSFFAFSRFNSGLAQRAPDPIEGENIAENLCSSCHIVGTSASGVVNADVPSFTSIANSPDQTLERIIRKIVIPHQPMPDLQLTRLEIADVAAYILSLRKEN